MKKFTRLSKATADGGCLQEDLLINEDEVSSVEKVRYEDSPWIGYSTEASCIVMCNGSIYTVQGSVRQVYHDLMTDYD